MLLENLVLQKQFLSILAGSALENFGNSHERKENMATIKVTVKNQYLKREKEEFICSNIDTSDLKEMEACAKECCGKFVELKENLINKLTGYLTPEQFISSCYYVIEEVDDV